MGREGTPEEDREGPDREVWGKVWECRRRGVVGSPLRRRVERRVRKEDLRVTSKGARGIWASSMGADE